MKRILTVAVVVGAIAAGWAALVYNAALVNETALAYSKNYVLNLTTTPNASGITRITAQAVYSSATLATSTFTDGRVSTNTLTVASNSGLVAAAATDQITVAATAVIASSAAHNSIVVASTNGLTGATITIAGATLVNNGWRVDKASDTAADIATQINTYVYQVVATAASSTVNLVARNKGVAGNAFTLAVSTTALTVGAASFSGGQEDAFQNQSITVNGVVYPSGYYWNVPNQGPTTSTGTAVSLATLLNTISGIQANAAGSVVYATATVSGTASNAFTIAASTSALTVLTPTFTGGADNAVITVNGTALRQGTHWTRGGTATLTAASIVTALTTYLSGTVGAANIAGVVFTTSTAVGTLSNYTATSSTPTALTWLHATYTGGANSAYTNGSPVINIPSHGYSTATPLLLTGSAVPSPLAAGTTYYAIPVDANDIELATTSARAQAGLYTTLTSSSVTGPHTSTLTPLAISGTMGLQWQVSNDCVNYTNYTTTMFGVAVSSLTFGTPYNASVTTWDLGPVNFQCIQAALVGPTTGGWAVKVTVNGSN